MSIATLTDRDEVAVFEYTHTQDDMGAWMEGNSTQRQYLRCRMQPMNGELRIQHDIPAETEAYVALFGFDPEIGLHHKAIYEGKVFSVVGTGNRSGQSWLWEVLLQYDPGLGIDV